MPRPCPFRPDFGPNLEGFPPIPKINSDAIRQQVFTHRSYYARPTHIFEDQPNDLSPDNEKLEHLGDTVLALVVTDMMIEEFPGLHVGPSTKIRALVVGNATLADISLRYRLPYRLRLHAAQAITLRASTNIQADVFESYVGGLYKDQGLAAVEKWLHPLLLPYAEEAYKFVRKQYGLPETRSSSGTLPTFHCRLRGSSGPRLPGRQISSTALAIGHLALFNQQLQKANLDIEWVYTEDATRTTPMWTVKAFVNGEMYGSGKGTSKKAARHVAAKEGLQRLGINVW
ncbi:ribonuclease III [Pleurotus eryngii]|uniref:Ribonuclease III n=1 Tax=Pleurotus eryngii TaxID=5323 RepID=A0A9P6A2K3_PLEER|nr:ribonuclease III [Pleurotus eryngii]